jgi:hypothetical protein
LSKNIESTNVIKVQVKEEGDSLEVAEKQHRSVSPVSRNQKLEEQMDTNKEEQIRVRNIEMERMQQNFI